MKKAKARRERSWPQTERVLSTKFPDGFEQVEGNCYVPFEDFRKLERKYLKLFKRYQKLKLKAKGGDEK
jgi:hypothetical protein